MYRVFIIIISVILLLSGGCAAPSDNPPAPATITVSSANFSDGAVIPVKYSCAGVNVSPEVSWTPGPEGTRFYVLIMNDPDAPLKPFAHWIVYNIPNTVTEMHEGISTNGILKTGSIQGRNDMGKLGYWGPCPSEGVHHYYITVYAVDLMYIQMASARMNDILDAIKGHILAQGQLIGTFSQ